MNSNVKQDSSSTLEGSVLILTCENEISSSMNMNITNEGILSVTCHSSGNWIPNPAQFTCSPSGSYHKFEFLLPASITMFKFTHSCIIILIPGSTIVSWARSSYAHAGESHSKRSRAKNIATPTTRHERDHGDKPPETKILQKFFVAT